MSVERNQPSGSTGMLLLKLLERKDLYGYEMIEALRRQSNHVFDLKAGTLYPLLHTLEGKGFVTSRLEEADGGRPRKYYHLTQAGKRELAALQTDWSAYTGAVNRVLEGGVCFG